jgi:parvulin-like peptidyl-prolyl isomerase
MKTSVPLLPEILLRFTLSPHLPIALATVCIGAIGCEPSPPAATPSAGTTAIQTTSQLAPATRPADLVADLSALKITRGDFDDFLYRAYGLRLLFDLVEFDLAKDTADARGVVVTPQDIEAERRMILKGIAGPETPESRYDDLFNQFLQNEHLSKAEFDLKIVQTDSYLRKIVTPIIVGKLPESAIHRGFEQLYGAKRQIADIELDNSLDATVARQRLRNEPFERVALAMSVDGQTKATGGLWQPFSTQSPWAPQVIRDAAFSMDKGQVSDILNAEGKFHIIKVVDVIDPKIVKFDDVKDDVRKQLEDQLITANMKQLRQELAVKAQQELHFDDPVLKQQWDDLVAQQSSKTTDRDAALKKLNEDHKLAATAPTSQP